jgi:hypothetical protein
MVFLHLRIGLCPLYPSPHNLIHSSHAFCCSLNLKPLLVFTTTSLAISLHPLISQLQVNQSFHTMSMGDFMHLLSRGTRSCCSRRRRRWRRRGRNVRVESDKTEVVPALSVPLIHAAVYIIRSADLQFDRLGGAFACGVCAHDIAGTSLTPPCRCLWCCE